jgi:hypothetical protein
MCEAVHTQQKSILQFVGRVERSATRHSFAGATAGYAALTRPTRYNEGGVTDPPSVNQNGMSSSRSLTGVRPRAGAGLAAGRGSSPKPPPA